MRRAFDCERNEFAELWKNYTGIDGLDEDLNGFRIEGVTGRELHQGLIRSELILHLLNKEEECPEGSFSVTTMQNGERFVVMVLDVKNWASKKRELFT